MGSKGPKGFNWFTRVQKALGPFKSCLAAGFVRIGVAFAPAFALAFRIVFRIAFGVALHWRFVALAVMLCGLLKATQAGC